MHGYKAFDPDLSCRGFQYEVGKTYEMEETPIICERGFHFCKELEHVYDYYPMRYNIRVCEVEALGNIVTDEDETKYCTNKITILRELDKFEKLDNSNYTSTGYLNTGDYNTGNYNRGDHNTGDNNNGAFNTGNRNYGNCNAGHCNYGLCNSGNFNIGNCNSGDFNISNGNNGSFNTVPHTIMLFNKPTNMTKFEWDRSLPRNWLLRMPFNLEKRQEWWDKALDNQQKENILNLPNFDYDIFKECTGIDARKK